jgi:hypothetical protein
LDFWWIGFLIAWVLRMIWVSSGWTQGIACPVNLTANVSPPKLRTSLVYKKESHRIEPNVDHRENQKMPREYGFLCFLRCTSMT